MNLEIGETISDVLSARLGGSFEVQLTNVPKINGNQVKGIFVKRRGGNREPWWLGNRKASGRGQILVEAG